VAAFALNVKSFSHINYVPDSIRGVVVQYILEVRLIRLSTQWKTARKGGSERLFSTPFVLNCTQ